VTARNHQWSVREATRADLPALSVLFEESFGFRRDASHTEWKFFDNPVGQPLVMVAEAQGRLVGQYALWPVELRIGGEVVLGAQSLDTMTHPEFRGQGMFARLAANCMELAESRGVKVLYGFPNRNSYPGFVERLNWDHTGDVPLWLRPLRPSLHPSLKGRLPQLFDSLTELLPGGGRAIGVDENPPPPEERAELWNGSWLDARRTCSIARTAKWERWRFALESQLRYEWLSVREGSDLLGYACWGADLRGPNALLSEICATSDKVLRALVSQVVARARRANHAFLATVTTIPPVRSALLHNGFFKRTGMPFIVRSLTTELLAANIHSHESWQLLGADLDTF
jgi:GNAT superfamily N-acetyltransferase